MRTHTKKLEENRLRVPPKDAKTCFVFVANRTISRAVGTLCRLSVVCDVLYCGETARPSEKLSEGVNRKPGSKSSFFGSPPYFYFRFRHYGHRDGRFCLIFARTASNRYNMVQTDFLAANHVRIVGLCGQN